MFYGRPLSAQPGVWPILRHQLVRVLPLRRRPRNAGATPSRCRVFMWLLRHGAVAVEPYELGLLPLGVWEPSADKFIK